MNDLGNIMKRSNQSTFYQFGISPLHALIRCFECLLHISYNMPFKKWSARSDVEKEQKRVRKEEIQKQFKQKMGLVVDMVKAGSGTSNDGNTTRRFFQHPSESAEITGLNLLLIQKFAVLLQVIACNKRIDTVKFENYAKNTAELYIDLYGWYYMPPTVHKILIHGSEIIKHAIIPIGQMSEEAQEARNKDFRHFRERNTRKISRKATNEDLLHQLLISSDPYISSLQKTKNHQKKKKCLKKQKVC